MHAHTNMMNHHAKTVLDEIEVGTYFLYREDRFVAFDHGCTEIKKKI